MKIVDCAYCYEKCETGKQAAIKCLEENTSTSDAAIDFYYFTIECFETCPYKEFHQKEDLTDVY